MSWLFGVALLGLASGLMIGCIGIGGVILAPSLWFFAGTPIQVAISAATFAYLLSGIVGTTVFAREKSIDWPMVWWLCLGAAPTAFLGGLTVQAADPRILQGGIGLLALGSGINALWPQQIEKKRESLSINKTLLVPIGAVVGFFSAISGTGGPMILVPILILMNLPVLLAVGLSQAIQLPIATAGTFGNLVHGRLDWSLAGTLAVVLTLGSWLGAKIAHRIPRKLMHRLVSVVLLVVGGLMLTSIVYRLEY